MSLYLTVYYTATYARIWGQCVEDKEIDSIQPKRRGSHLNIKSPASWTMHGLMQTIFDNVAFTKGRLFCDELIDELRPAFGDADFTISGGKLPMGNPGEARTDKGLREAEQGLMRAERYYKELVQRNPTEAQELQARKVCQLNEQNVKKHRIWQDESATAVAMDQFRIKVKFSDRQRGVKARETLSLSMKKYLKVAETKSKAIEGSMFRNIAFKAKKHTVNAAAEVKKERLATEAVQQCSIGLRVA